MPATPDVPGDATALCAENERLRVLVEEKDGQIAELRERVARLERLVSRNSGNSSMPPSTDDQPGKKPPDRRARRGGRNPGKQRRAGRVPCLARGPGRDG